MRWMNDRYARTSLTDRDDQFGLSLHLNRASAVRDADMWRPDNYQPVESAWNVPGPTALIDVYTPDENTTGTLVVDGSHVIAACDTPGDNDWFAVTLTAGVTYQFGQYAYTGHIAGVEGNGFPLADAYLEIYDSAGNLLSVADGGGPNTPSGLDALMTFEAPSSGTFYVNATSWDNDGDGIGDFAGDYELFAITATTGVYTTPYDISSPLHSIDWGGVMVNREHVSVRNPDGMEGPRPTGQPAADPADVEGNALGFPGKNVIYLYFAGEGDTYANADSTIPAQVTAQDPYQYEIQAMLTAANEFSKVADVVFVSNYTFNASTGLYERNENIEYKPGPLPPEPGVQYATGVDGDGFDADFFYWSYPGTPGPVISLLGSMNPPDYGDEGVAQFNSADERWNAQMLQQGGFSFVTLIHEFGHGMGLAHPHDTGGGSSVMQGVVTSGVPGDDGGAGAFDLNQGVNTMMSYNDGWEMSPYGQAETNNEGYGWLGSLMALDIAVIQDKYGVNEDWATGNDSYVLKDVNEWGVYIDAATGQPAVHDATNQATARDGYYEGQSTYYSSIWDAQGVDQIIYNGARDTNIDLRAATLQYEYGGAGWMSYANDIYGGFTIANGVVIENAFSGAGDDTLTGNAVANVLDGGAGADVMLGGLGGDSLVGGEGIDTASYADDYGAVIANLALGQGFGNAAQGDTYSSIENALGSIFNDTFIGSDAVNRLDGGDGDDTLTGGLGADILVGGAGIDTVSYEDNYGAVIANLALGQGFGNAAQGDTYSGIENALGSIFNDTFIGSDAVNRLDGGDGDDNLIGSLGGDALVGGAGIDTASYEDNWGAVFIDLLRGNGYGNAAQGDTYDGIENLRGSIFNDYFIGSDDVNRIEGGDGNDTLLGALGADVLIGGNGNDTASYEDNQGAVIGNLTEGRGYGNAAEGDLYTGIENLTGTVFNDTFFGDAGANILAGRRGNDTLVGGDGADIFVFDTALEGAINVDAILDFVAADDTIQLSQSVFAGLGLGTLSAGAFVTGSAAADADDRIVYNAATGELFYDADGNGAGAAQMFATLQTGLALTASDFIVV